MGIEQFSYDNFAATYKNDPRLKNIINNFDGENIRFKQKGVDTGAGLQDGNTVKQMAKRATDLTDLA